VWVSAGWMPGARIWPPDRGFIMILNRVVSQYGSRHDRAVAKAQTGRGTRPATRYCQVKLSPRH
jgi:hypothetical protein